MKTTKTVRWTALLFLLGAGTILAGVQQGRTAGESPIPDKRAVVIAGDARFTVLTPSLIRMEWSPEGRFEDRASLLFTNRLLPVPAFTVDTSKGWLVITTETAALRYRRGSGRFSPGNLSVEFTCAGKTSTWHPGLADTANLGGTTRTLDGVRGATPLEPGLLSRDGWVVVDDSRRPLFDHDEWPWVIPRTDTLGQDLTLFAYGHRYKELLHDFTRVAGRIPMPPRFAFGTWWSRYWAYTDAELKQLVHEFAIHDVPLDVLVVDMDWHLTFNQRWDKDVRDQAGQRLGWTGYTWDRDYFPDPEGFLRWCEGEGLKTTLNLHPASGIQPHEVQYPAMAKAMGIDPSTKRYVPFDIVDRRFTRNFLDLVIRPLEEQGIDFWWLDWQQWGTTTITGVTPTWWLNYVFFTSMERRKTTRPILFHRWGGLGNHRYQVGFSGDVVSAWESLAFQPTFTATAANVGFGYWSHDIGGHMGGAPTPEMYTRWVQFGAFSPVLRTHTTKDPNSERRIWGYPLDNFLVMRDAFVLRYSLIPYVYTQARRTYDTGISLCRPMYYDWPESPEAYRFPGEYMFGDDILVAPIATPVADSSLLAAKDVWLPEGKWMEWWTGSALTGPAIVTRSFALDEIPAYVRAGSVIPMQQKTNRANARPLDPLILTIFAGDSGSTSVYEDQGNSLGYLRGECAWTDVRHTRRTDGTRRVDIAPVRGGFPRMLARRGYEVRLRGVLPPARVTCNGTVLPYTTAKKHGWWYDGETLTLTIATPVRPVRERTVLEVVPAGRGESGASLTSGFMGAQARLRRVMGMINKHWPREWSPDRLVRAVQTGNRIGRHPETSREELAAFWQSVTAFRDTLPALRIPESTRAIVGRHLEGIHGPR